MDVASCLSRKVLGDLHALVFFVARSYLILSAVTMYTLSPRFWDGPHPVYRSECKMPALQLCTVLIKCRLLPIPSSSIKLLPPSWEWAETCDDVWYSEYYCALCGNQSMLYMACQVVSHSVQRTCLPSLFIFFFEDASSCSDLHVHTHRDQSSHACDFISCQTQNSYLAHASCCNDSVCVYFFEVGHGKLIV